MLLEEDKADSHRSRTVIHHWTSLLRHTNVTSLLSKFSNSTLLRRLTRIYESRRNLNNNCINWRPVLLLEKQLRASIFVQNSDDPNAIKIDTGRTSLGKRG